MPDDPAKHQKPEDLAADGDEVVEGVEPPTNAELKKHRAHPR